MKKADRKTDWTKYYQGKKSIFSRITQKYTLKYISNAIAGLKKTNIEVMECGGGNSCFARELTNNHSEISEYDIADNNEYAVNLFNEIDLNVPHMGTKIDLVSCENADIDKQYDFVYSVGLIEHFSDEDRKKVIEKHFSLCKPGGTVLISFPTPTMKYRICRRFMELIHVWQFWDETPLKPETVETLIEKDAKVVRGFLNKELPLSQYILIAVKDRK